MVRLFLTILPEGGEEQKHIDYIHKAVLVDVGCRAIRGASEISQEQVSHFNAAVSIDLRKNPSE